MAIPASAPVTVVRPSRFDPALAVHFARQLPRLVVTLVTVTVVTVLLVELMPGDPARLAAGEFATDAVVERTRQELRLDDAVVVRYFGWAGDAIQGDLGNSVRMQPGRGVTEMIGKALPTTLTLAGSAMVLAVVIGVPAGALAALRRGRWVDRLLTFGSAASLAVPSFVVGVVLVTWFAIDRDLLPATGYVSPWSDPIDGLRFLVLPSLALAVTPAAEISRQVRGAMVDTFERDYVRTARAKGLSRRKLLLKHVGKGAAGPVVTVIGLRTAATVGGAVVIERMFVIPGIGSLAVEAVTSRDVPVIQGIVLVGSLFVLLVNLLVDLIHAYLDPRTR